MSRRGLEPRTQRLKGAYVAANTCNSQKVGGLPGIRTRTKSVKSRVCNLNTCGPLNLWLCYSPVSVEDEHSSEPSTRPSSRSTSTQVLFEVAPVWSSLTRMTPSRISPYPKPCGPRIFHGTLLRCDRNFLVALARPAFVYTTKNGKVGFRYQPVRNDSERTTERA